MEKEIEIEVIEPEVLDENKEPVVKKEEELPPNLGVFTSETVTAGDKFGAPSKKFG